MPDSQPRRPDDNAPDSADAATTADHPALVLGGARLADGRTVDVRLSGSRIEAVGTAGSLSARGPRIDLRGYLLLPAPAEPHAHSDTALTADSAGPDSPGPASHRAEDIQRRATEAALLQLGHGATALRSHVRVGDVQGLAPLEAVLQTRRALRGLADVMPVAVPRLLTGIAGADSLAMLRDAVKMGAAVVGGCPDLDPDPTGYTQAVLEIAAEHGCPVDLHTDGDDPARLARLTAMAAGLRPGVTLGPCGGLAHLPLDAAARAADRLAAAGITVVCLPQGGCAGRGAPYDRPRTPAALRRSARRGGQWCAAGHGEPRRSRRSARSRLSPRLPGRATCRTGVRPGLHDRTRGPRPSRRTRRGGLPRRTPRRTRRTALRGALPRLQPHRHPRRQDRRPHQRRARVLRLR